MAQSDEPQKLEFLRRNAEKGLPCGPWTRHRRRAIRPLLAYLNVQAKRAEAAGDSTALESIRKRIDLVYQSLPKTN